MKTKLRPSKARTSSLFFKIIFWAGLFAFVLLFLTIYPVLTEPLTKFGLNLSQPFLKFKIKVSQWKASGLALFQEKTELAGENSLLKERISEIETKALRLDALEKENQNLRTLLNNFEEKSFVLAPVLARPSQVRYDTLVIGAGSNQNIEKGMPVTAFGQILLGYITDVSTSISKVKLISFLNQETNVVFQNLELSAVAVGKGGENLEISLPRSIEIEIGEPIVSQELQLFAVGLVERIEKDETRPVQKILFRLPLNLHYLNYVLVDSS